MFLPLRKIINYAVFENFNEVVIQNKTNECWIYFFKSDKIIKSFKTKELFFKTLKKDYFWQKNKSSNSEKNLKIDFNLEGKIINLKITYTEHKNKEYFVISLFQETVQLLPLTNFFSSNSNQNKIFNYLNNPQGLSIINSEKNLLSFFYSLLNIIKEEEKNIYTLESFVYRRFHGINQVKIDQRLGRTQISYLNFLLREKFDLLILEDLNNLKTARLIHEIITSGKPVLLYSRFSDPTESLLNLIKLGFEPEKIKNYLNLFLHNFNTNNQNNYQYIQYEKLLKVLLNNPRISLNEAKKLIH